MLGAATRRAGCMLGEVGGLIPGVLGVFDEPFELLFPWILFRIDIYTSGAAAITFIILLPQLHLELQVLCITLIPQLRPELQVL